MTTNGDRLIKLLNGERVTTVYGSTHPVIASVRVGTELFICEDEDDWGQCIHTALYGLATKPGDSGYITRRPPFRAAHQLPLRTAAQPRRP